MSLCSSATLIRFATAEFRVLTSARYIYYSKVTATPWLVGVCVCAAFFTSIYFKLFCFLRYSLTDFDCNIYQIYVMGNQCAHSVYAPTTRSLLINIYMCKRRFVAIFCFKRCRSSCLVYLFMWLYVSGSVSMRNPVFFSLMIRSVQIILLFITMIRIFIDHPIAP